MERAGKQTEFRPRSQLAYQNLMNQPVILVTGFNNPWTMQLNRELRFGLYLDARTHAVVDQWKPGRRWTAVGGSR